MIVTFANKMPVCSLCGLFGKHKSHELVTQSDMKEANKEMLLELKSRFDGLIDFERLRKSSSYGDYIQASVSEKVKEIRQGIRNRFEVL